MSILLLPIYSEHTVAVNGRPENCNGILENLELLSFMRLLIRAILEEAAKNDYPFENLGQLFDEIRAFGESPVSHLDNQIRILNPLFYRTPTDGRSRRFNISPTEDRESAKYKLLQYIGLKINNPRILEMGMMFQIKGGGANMVGFETIKSTWTNCSKTPFGLTGVDHWENTFGGLMGLENASRVLLFSIGMTSIDNSSGEIVVGEDTLNNISSEGEPMVLELFAVPGGYCLSDFEYLFGDIWEYIKQLLYLYTGKKYEYKPYSEDETTKELMIYNLFSHYRSVFSKIARIKIDAHMNVYILLNNRTSQNSTLAGFQDLDMWEGTEFEPPSIFTRYLNTQVMHLTNVFPTLENYIKRLKEKYPYLFKIEEATI